MRCGQARLGLGQNQQVFELQVIVEFQLLLRQQAVLFLLLDQGPNSLARFRRSPEIRQVSRGNVPDQKVNDFVTRIHAETLAGSRGLGKNSRKAPKVSRRTDRPRVLSPAGNLATVSDVEFGLHVQAALNMALLSLLKDKVAKFDLAKQEIVL